MHVRRNQRDRSIELLEDKADVLRKVADMAHEIDGANRARGEDIELQAESELGATESAIEALEDHRATLD